MHWEEVWTGQSARDRLMRTLLTPASWLYALGWQSYLATYRLGLKKPIHPTSPIICIGNLQVGGTGKSPVTLHVADVLRELGYQVVLSASGYGSPAAEAAQVAPTGELLASSWGDEAAMIRLLKPDLPLIVGRRRPLAAKLAAEHFPGAAMLMDDGFQHLPLEKDVSIILDPPGPNHRCLPAGPYREPYRNRSRADLVLPGIFQVRPKPLQGIGSGISRVNVLCALGRPEGFLRALRSEGVEIAASKLLPDHDPLSGGNLLDYPEPRLPLIVTAKDWVKLRERADVGNYDIRTAGHEVTIEPAEQFKDWLKARLDGIATQGL